MGSISRLCQRSFWIDAGRLCMSAPSEEVISKYLTSGSLLAGQFLCKEGISNPGVNELRIHSVCILNSAGQVTAKLDARKPFLVEIRYSIIERLPFCRVGFIVSTPQGVTLFEVYDSDDERYIGPREPGEYVTKCEIPGNFLKTGWYILSINVGMPSVKNLAFLEGILRFDIEETGGVGYPMNVKRDGIILPKLRWEVITEWGVIPKPLQEF